VGFLDRLNDYQLLKGSAAWSHQNTPHATSAESDRGKKLQIIRIAELPIETEEVSTLGV
jgi:hypothetical protein